MRHKIFVLSTLSCLLGLPGFAQSSPISIESGKDVGEASVLYDIPYDPKRVDQLTFVSPSVSHPFYEIVVPLGDWTEGPGASIKEVRVNDLPCESYYVFVDGLARLHGPQLTDRGAIARNVVVVARALWHNEEKIAVELGISGQSGTLTRSFEGIAPSRGGGPEGWHRYQSFTLHETGGIDRANEPVECSIVVPARHCQNLEREIRVFMLNPDDSRWIPLSFQTLNFQQFPGTPPGTSDTMYLHEPSQSIEVVFLASVPGRESRVCLVVYDNPEASSPTPEPTDLVVTGPSLGATVENKFYVVDLDDKSGQIAYFQLKRPDGTLSPRLTNSSAYAAHWNPDSYSDSGQWGHTFAWNPPESTVVTARGPILFRITNSGRMPGYTPQIYVTVSYSFYASVPYVKVLTVTEVRDPLNASAIRNGEIVLNSHLVTHFVWEEKTGELRTVRTAAGPNWQDEWATRVDHDVPWIAMTNELDDYGVGMVTTASLAFNPSCGEAAAHRPMYYLYYHHNWALPLTYFTRAWVYPFSDYQRGPILPVEAGSTYLEKGAFLVFALHEEGGRYRDIQTASRQLYHPLAVRWGR